MSDATVLTIEQYELAMMELFNTGSNIPLKRMLAHDLALRSQRDALAEALRVMLTSHYNLYKGTFGEDSDPENDLIRRQALQALAAAPEAGKP